MTRLAAGRGAHWKTVWTWKYEPSADGTFHAAFDLWDARVARGGAMEPGDNVTFDYNGYPYEGVVYENDSGSCRVMISKCFRPFTCGMVAGLFLELRESELAFADRPYMKPEEWGWGDDTPCDEL